MAICPDPVEEEQKMPLNKPLAPSYERTRFEASLVT
jgi:hypothetical protein